VKSPLSQSQYQVRFDWGVRGAVQVAPDVDVFVLVDVLGASRGALPGNPVIDLVAALADHPAAIVAGSLRNAAAVARWALDRQGDKGDRFTVAVVAAGEVRDDASTRFALEDLLGAGAIIDALASVGIDYCSPESAAVNAAFTGLRNATGALISASASGRELTAEGRESEVKLAIAIDSDTAVPVLREFSFRA
jgi:2-phosphosulfolactate phosphatase